MTPGNIFAFQYACRLPQNLKLDNILQKNPMVPTFYKKNHIAIKNRLALVLDMLMGSLSIQWNHGENKDCFANLCSTILQDLVKDYKKYLDYAIETRIIEKGDDYIVNRKCTSYRFTAAYRTSRRLQYHYI